MQSNREGQVSSVTVPASGYIVHFGVVKVGVRELDPKIAQTARSLLPTVQLQITLSTFIRPSEQAVRKPQDTLETTMESVA